MFTNKFFFLLLFLSLPCLAFDPSAKMRALVVRSAGSDFMTNPFIEKCFQSKELPQISVPTIQVATDPSLGKKLYLIQFNGTELRPQLILATGKKVELEKSSDQMGYMLSLIKDTDDSHFDLQFEIQNPNQEYVHYVLQIQPNEARFTEQLSESQAQRVCIKNQFWLGVGASVFSFDQKIDEIEAKSKFTSITPGSMHFDLRYYPSSQWGVLGSYKSAPGKIKTESTSAIDTNQFRWTIYELAFQWRNQDWMKRWDQFLIYPYLRGSYQIHQMPRIFINEVGDSALQSFGLHQATLGVGMNVFDRGSRFFEAYLNVKRPLLSVGQSTVAGLHFDGALGFGTKIHERYNIGAFWHGHYDNFKSTSSQNNFENLSQTTLIYSSVDLKLGWSF